MFLLSLVLPAAAHIGLTSHEARHGWTYIKEGPCGLSGSDWGSGEIYTYRPGATVALEWDEFIDHPGHYRVSFDPDGDDDFVDPASFEDYYTNEFVIADNIPDHEDGRDLYTYDLVLPDIESDRATIQVVQVMTDKEPYGDGDDLYYNCVDVILSADAPEDTDADNAGDEKGCAVAPLTAGVWWLGLAVLWRRRGSSGG